MAANILSDLVWENFGFGLIAQPLGARVQYIIGDAQAEAIHAICIIMQLYNLVLTRLTMKGKSLKPNAYWHELSGLIHWKCRAELGIDLLNFAHHSTSVVIKSKTLFRGLSSRDI